MLYRTVCGFSQRSEGWGFRRPAWRSQCRLRTAGQEFRTGARGTQRLQIHHGLAVNPAVARRSLNHRAVLHLTPDTLPPALAKTPPPRTISRYGYRRQASSFITISAPSSRSRQGTSSSDCGSPILLIFRHGRP